MVDYCITWSYIVERMGTKYGFYPNNTEKLSMGEIEKYLNDIWNEFFEMKLAEEQEELKNEIEN